MKHVAKITTDTATCSCGFMPIILRASAESIGKFTVEADACWRLHVEMSRAGQGDLFGMQFGLFKD